MGGGLAHVALKRCWPRGPHADNHSCFESENQMRFPTLPKNDLPKLFGDAHPAWKVLGILADRSPYVALLLLLGKAVAKYTT
jgi:hypothetical protein